MVVRSAASSATRPVSSRFAVLAWTLGLGTVFCQILYSTADPRERTPLTVLIVLCFAAASLSDAWARCGPRAALALLTVAGGGGLVAEVTGLRTGFPFGQYHYTDALGWSLFGVPVVVPLAWVMMAWPALLAGRVLAARPWAVVAVSAGALASWDVFLDPQMVDAGYWIWASPEPALPGVEGVPLTNFAGWLLVAALIQAVLHRMTRETDARASSLRTGPAPVLYLWTWISSIWAHAAFFGRPWVALVGGVLMGLVAVPFAVALVKAHR